MNSGRYVFSQIVSFFPKYEFDKIVSKYKGHYKVQKFSCWSQFLCLCFGQLTQRESLRDIVTCLRSHSDKLYHLGIRHGVARSTLADANEKRDWRIYAEFSHILIRRAQALYSEDDSFGLDLKATIYALDSTTIDLCLSVYPWTPSSKNRAAIKIHTLMDLRGSIPVWIRFSDGLTHDMNLMDELFYEYGAFYIMDRGYIHLEQLYRMHSSKSFFIIRAKKNLNFVRLYSNPKSKESSILFDQVGRFHTYRSKKLYPENIRAIKSKDVISGKEIIILTNNFQLKPEYISQLYKSRWQIEMFFKWIKQHLQIKKFWGYSPNAVKTHIWVAIANYVLIAILKKELKTDLSIYEMLQIFSVSALDKTPVNQLLSKNEPHKINQQNPNQLIFNW